MRRPTIVEGVARSEEAADMYGVTVMEMSVSGEREELNILSIFIY